MQISALLLLFLFRFYTGFLPSWQNIALKTHTHTQTNTHTHTRSKTGCGFLEMSAVIVASPKSQVPSSSSQQPRNHRSESWDIVPADSLLSRSESARCYGDDLSVWSALPRVLSGLGEVESEAPSAWNWVKRPSFCLRWRLKKRKNVKSADQSERKMNRFKKVNLLPEGKPSRSQLQIEGKPLGSRFFCFFSLQFLRRGSVAGWIMTVNGWCLITTWTESRRKKKKERVICCQKETAVNRSTVKGLSIIHKYAQNKGENVSWWKSRWPLKVFR